eukprot:8942459-Pyramimonas_sp.AAC.2
MIPPMVVLKAMRPGVSARCVRQMMMIADCRLPIIADVANCRLRMLPIADCGCCRLQASGDD